jgi:hypothetical protein
MTWRKLSSLPEQKIVGAYKIEFWAIRGGNVWHQGRKLRLADAATFEVFENQNFIARDAFCIYHAWSRLPQIDRDSFIKDGEYWKDKNSVYSEYETSLRVLQESNAKNFHNLGGGYGADEKTAWYFGRKIKNCTLGRDLRVIEENQLYASDGEKIYFGGKPLSSVHAAQWRILNDFFSCDEKHIYYTERKLPRVDIQSWQHVYKTWSKDKNHVFHMNLIEKGVLPNDFDKSQALEKYK